MGDEERTSCCDGPLGAVRDEERPSWLIAEPRTTAKLLSASPLGVANPSVMQASPLPYLQLRQPWLGTDGAHDSFIDTRYKSRPSLSKSDACSSETKCVGQGVSFQSFHNGSTKEYYKISECQTLHLKYQRGECI